MVITKPICLIGYSGHAFVIADIFVCMGRLVTAYCERHKKVFNPYELLYLGKENDTKTLRQLADFDYFICIGDNKLREKLYLFLEPILGGSIVAIHPSANISKFADIADGVVINAGSTLNSLSKIETGVICNTGSIIEHECEIGSFSHIGPGATLCGNVKVGRCTFIGANAVIRQNIHIGNNSIIGAGTIITKDIPDNVTVIGNPNKFI